jgi:hypothetical protein
VRVLEGLFGDSDREGYKRLYFTREMDYYAEFPAEGIHREPLPRDQPPFLGDEASRVTIGRDVPIEFTRTETPQPLDQFDLDVRLGDPGGRRAEVGVLRATEMTCGTCDTHCGSCRTCDSCFTCLTCHTQCGTCFCR